MSNIRSAACAVLAVSVAAVAWSGRTTAAPPAAEASCKLTIQGRALGIFSSVSVEESNDRTRAGALTLAGGPNSLGKGDFELERLAKSAKVTDFLVACARADRSPIDYELHNAVVSSIDLSKGLFGHASIRVTLRYESIKFSYFDHAPAQVGRR
jgi:hypothetical protein